MSNVNASKPIIPDGLDGIMVRNNITLVQGKRLPCVSIVTDQIHLHMTPAVAVEVASNLVRVALAIDSEKNTAEYAMLETVLQALDGLHPQ
jgi:hypothetical protein